MAETVQSVDPRTGQAGPTYPALNPVRRARRRGRVRAGGGLRRMARRQAPRGLPARRGRPPARGRRRDRRAGPVRDRPARGPRGRRARAHLRPARGVRRRRRRRRLRRRDDRHRRPRRAADPAARRAPHARADRPGRRVRRQQLPARLRHRRRRHRLRAGRRLPGGRQGPPVPPGHERGRRRQPGRGASPTPACPTGTFALVQAAGNEVGEALVDAPAIAAVGFTGSLAAGRALYRARRAPPASRSRSTPRWAASTRSWSPRARWPSAPTRSPSELAGVGVDFGGQLCTKPGVVLVPEGESGRGLRAGRGRPARRARGRRCMLNERLRSCLGDRVQDLDADGTCSA